MQLEAIRVGDNFIIPMLRKMNIKQDKIKIYIDDETIDTVNTDKKGWKELSLQTHSSDLDDDERLYEAAARFYSEKHSD